MQAAVMYKPGDIRLEEVPKPEPKKGEALLRIAAVGVCGSDIPRMLTKGAHRMPIICGHEFSGEIVEVGEEVNGFDVGELVGVAPMLPCRVCDQCMTGNFSRCRNYDYFGSRRDGAYAEFVAAPVQNLLKAPKGTDPRAIAMTDPASIALHAVWKAPPTMGERGAVVGCGPIGLFAIQWMRLMGCTEVVAIDLASAKLEQAREAGATQTFLSHEAPADLPCDLIIEAAGVPALDQSRGAARGPRRPRRVHRDTSRRRVPRQQDLPAFPASGSVAAWRVEFLQPAVPGQGMDGEPRCARRRNLEMGIHDHA